MGLGYTTMLYDETSLQTGFSDIGACRYNGIELGLEKLRTVGPTTVKRWLAKYDLELYCVMAEWPIDEEAIKRICQGVQLAAEANAQYYGFLPPERHKRDKDTIARWLDDISKIAAKTKVTPVIHHHGGTAIEQPDEIEYWMETGPDNFELLFDTAHYYPYSSVTEGIERFDDDIAYVHVKDVDPPASFDEHTAALSSESHHLDNVINYFRAFTDLGAGVLNFNQIYDRLIDAGYNGHITVEIENQTERPLVHAKQNFDYLTEILD